MRMSSRMLGATLFAVATAAMATPVFAQPPAAGPAPPEANGPVAPPQDAPPPGPPPGRPPASYAGRPRAIRHSHRQRQLTRRTWHGCGGHHDHSGRKQGAGH